MPEHSLQNQIALIIGAGRKPAPELALALAAQGAVIAANDLSPVLLDPLVETISRQDGRIRAYVADATRGMPLRAMLDEVLEHWGRIDILINNPRIQPTAPLLTMDEWDWQRTIEMNLNGPFLVMQLVAKIMREQGRGTILNLVDANQPAFEKPGQAAYSASQQGLLALSQAAADEFFAYNIHVHTLCPDETFLYDDQRLITARTTPAAFHASGPGEELTGLAVFLCGPEAAHLAGQVFRVRQSPQPGAVLQEKT
jgi:3-oxoacyl-[acyl-carrier protein] reductase